MKSDYWTTLTVFIVCGSAFALAGLVYLDCEGNRKTKAEMLKACLESREGASPADCVLAIEASLSMKR